MDSKLKLIIIGIIILILFLGTPDKINVFGLEWCLKNCEITLSSNPDGMTSFNSQLVQQTTPTTPAQILVVDLLSIDNLKSRQKVYRLGDTSIIDFKIVDERNLPYNFTVYWLHNDTSLYGWSNESNLTQNFYSDYAMIPKKGKWKVQVVLKWVYQNQTFSKDELTEFDVS